MDKFKRLREFMDEVIEKNKFPGIDCVVYQNHEEIFRHTAGYMDMENKVKPAKNALYNIYSATKLITITAALQLVEQGRMLLLDPLYKYLPEYENMMVKYGTFTLTPAKNKITIADLMTMTAGIHYDGLCPTLAALRQKEGENLTTRKFAEALAKEPLLCEPGEGWNYGFCHEVLGAVIEVVSGLNFEDYLQKNIFEPLGMSDSSFKLKGDRAERVAPQYNMSLTDSTITKISNVSLAGNTEHYFSGGGGLIMPTDDYILFADAMACGGIGKTGAKILSAPYIELMAKNRLKGKKLEDYMRFGLPEGYGYGLGCGVVYDQAAALSTRPDGAFSWGGLGGCSNQIDPKNKLSAYLSMHLIFAPKHIFWPHMLNILYSSL